MAFKRSAVRSRLDDGDIVAFQVKQTNISNSVARKVLYNWLIALNKNRAINRFELILDEGYAILTLSHDVV